VRDNYPKMAEEKGNYFMAKLRGIENPDIKEIRGKGLLIGVEFHVTAEKYVKALIANGVLAKETHEKTIRFAPPITISYEEIDEAMEGIRKALGK
ncbi:MAG: aminotransferase class III-fold pyridoxal phosphate-dependent enzyme, partial [Lachnospiraceae bacterium]|nr:aminotransferase class III-fold pyridoxal phosphate-dependent enzyme [Lachnospiraceae bacterium]